MVCKFIKMDLDKFMQFYFMCSSIFMYCIVWRDITLCDLCLTHIIRIHKSYINLSLYGTKFNVLFAYHLSMLGRTWLPGYIASIYGDSRRRMGLCAEVSSEWEVGKRRWS